MLINVLWAPSLVASAPNLSNPKTQENRLVHLGERLFNDTRLSADGQVSCASCHIKTSCFADDRPRAIGLHDQAGTRNTPSLYNVKFLQNLFWEGRAASLEEQASSPLTNPIEHGLANEDAVVHFVSDDLYYSRELSAALGIRHQAIQFSDVATALATFQRTLVDMSSPFDSYFLEKNSTAFSESAIRGLRLFQGRAGCISCHSMDPKPSIFTDQQFHASPLKLSQEANANLGELTARVEKLKTQRQADELNRLIATNAAVASLGRFLVTLNPEDIGKFRTPSLRNVTRTAPYMHDGSVQSLEQSVDLELYGRGNIKYPIILTTSEKRDLIEFLGALTSTNCVVQPIN